MLSAFDAVKGSMRESNFFPKVRIRKATPLSFEEAGKLTIKITAHSRNDFSHSVNHQKQPYVFFCSEAIFAAREMSRPKSTSKAPVIRKSVSNVGFRKSRSTRL